jgi:NDP-sugar pyrophosphorylase family protein
MKAFILAAGLGTRLRPITNDIPKALVQINGVPLIEHAIKRLKNNGCNKIIINLYHYADKVIKFLASKNYLETDITISDESGFLLDTGGGLKKISWFFAPGESFIVHNVDIIADFEISELYKRHLSSGKIATLAVQKRESSRYFLFDEERSLCGWENIKTGEQKIARKPVGNLGQYAFSGIHSADSGIFKYFPEENVFSLVDLFLKAASHEKITFFDHTGSRFIDVGKKENLIKAEVTLPNMK